MACSHFGSNLIQGSIQVAIIALETIPPVLTEEGLISQPVGQAIQKFVTTAVNDFDGALADLRSSTGTLDSAIILVKDAQQAFNDLAAAELPAPIVLVVRVIGTSILIVMQSIESEIGPAPTPVTGSASPAAFNAHGQEKIEPDVIEKLKLTHYQGRLKAVKEKVDAFVAEHAEAK